MGMTTTDESPPATGSPREQPPPHAKAQPPSNEATPVPHARSGSKEGTAVSPPHSGTPQHSEHLSGEDESDQDDADAAGSSAGQDDPPSPQGHQGQEAETGTDDAGPSHQRPAPQPGQRHEDQRRDTEVGTGAHGSSPLQEPAPTVPHQGDQSHDRGAGGDGATVPSAHADPGAPPGRASQTAPQALPEAPTSNALSTQGDSENVGWFSTSADPAQITRTLSERLSAERPVDEPVGGPSAEEDASTGSAVEQLKTQPPTGLPGPPDFTTPADSPQAEESHEAGVSQSTESRSDATGDATGVPSEEGHRSPELIEAGMVYVDPDPQIGPPSAAPRAAGWDEQPPASPSPAPSAAPPGEPTAAGPTNAEPTHETRPPSLTGVTSVPTVPPPDHAAGSAEPPGQQDTGAPYRQHQHGSDDQLPSTESNLTQATVAEGAVGSITDELSWTEPSLPMGGLPAGQPSAIGEGEPAPHDEDATAQPSIPRPDPSWPSLFEQRQGDPELRVEEASDNLVPSSDHGGIGARTGFDALADRAAGIRGSTEDAVSSTDERMTTQLPSAPGEQPGVSAGIVDLTDVEAPLASEAATQTDHAKHSAIGSGPQSLASGVQTPEQANISTVAQIVDAAAQVDLRDRPVGPPGEDVSRETSAGGGEGMDRAHEEEALEDEAALAVREAVSRAAAEAGVDVSRETELMDAGSPIDGLAGEPSIDSEAAARNARVSFRIHRESLNGTRRVVAVANQKGGVGKSTTAVNIGAYLALAGARVLVVDLDPQGNASTGLGLDHRDIEPSIYDVLTGDAPPTAAIRATSVANLHVLPSTIDLAGAEVELVSAMSRETRLGRALESIDHEYDTILIDCPPSLGLLTVNALAAANELLIPIQCEYYALEGLGQLLRNVELVRANLNPELRIGGIVLTMYDGRTRLALQVVDEVRKHFTDLVYQTVVPRSVRLSEAPGYGLPIALYDPLSRGGIAYRDLTFELAERSGLLAPTGEGAS
jgi:chromosome partitioning protein